VATLLSLAETHRRSQDALRAALEAYLKRVYAQMMAAPAGRPMAEQWIATVLPMILRYRARSEGLARLAYRTQRALAYPNAPTPPEPDAVDDDELEQAVASSLWATGWADLRERLSKDEPELDAITRAGTLAAGAGVRHALNGGRDYTQRVIAVDNLAVGWYRVTKGDPCSFCAVLASRGAVYKQDSFNDSDPRFIGDGEEKVHDHCACTLAPIYTRGQPVPDRNQDFADLWAVTSPGFSGKDALNSFRRAYEARQRAATMAATT
jgi:hypothetical protein